MDRTVPGSPWPDACRNGRCTAPSRSNCPGSLTTCSRRRTGLLRLETASGSSTAASDVLAEVGRTKPIRNTATASLKQQRRR